MPEAFSTNYNPEANTHEVRLNVDPFVDTKQGINQEVLGQFKVAQELVNKINDRLRNAQEGRLIRELDVKESQVAAQFVTEALNKLPAPEFWGAYGLETDAGKAAQLFEQNFNQPLERFLAGELEGLIDTVDSNDADKPEDIQAARKSLKKEFPGLFGEMTPEEEQARVVALAEELGLEIPASMRPQVARTEVPEEPSTVHETLSRVQSGRTARKIMMDHTDKPIDEQ